MAMTWVEILEDQSGDVACRYDPELWFNDHQIPQAARFCRECPVQLRCLLLGLDEDHGVWGGLATRRRRWLRQEVFPGDTPKRAGERAREIALSRGDDIDLLEMLPAGGRGNAQLVSIAKV